jgi:hypothetical protein
MAYGTIPCASKQGILPACAGKFCPRSREKPARRRILDAYADRAERFLKKDAPLARAIQRVGSNHSLFSAVCATVIAGSSFRYRQPPCRPE